MIGFATDFSFERLATIPVREVFKRQCLQLESSATVAEAASMMARADRGSVVVTDGDGRVIGIFTEHDVLKHSTTNSPDWRHRSIANAMTPEPVTVYDFDSVAGALARMSEGRFRHVPVVDADGRPLAVVTIRLVLSFIAEHFPEEIYNLPPDSSLEARSPYGG